MDQEIINNGETGLVVRTKINNMNSELYANAGSGVASWTGTDIITINADTTKFDITEIKIDFVDRSDPDPDNHARVPKTFIARTALTADHLTTNVGTWLGYQEDGTLVQSPTEFTPEQRNTIVQIGRLGHFGKTVITGTFDFPWIFETSDNWAMEKSGYGTELLFGAEVSANGANLKIDRSIGNFIRVGAGSTRNAINFPQTPAGTQISMIPAYNSATYEGILGSATTDVDVTHYDDRSGTLQDISTDQYANVYILHFPYKSTVTTMLIYGNKEYNALATAEQGALNKEYSIPSDITGGVIVASISAKKETTDLTAAIAGGTATIKPSIQAGGGGGSVISYWDKVGVDLSPATPGDNIKLTTGNIQLGDAVIEHENETHAPIYSSGQTGLDDLLSSGTYTLDGNAVFQVRIDGVGSPNTFEWRKGIDGTWNSDIPFEGLTNFITLQDGISVAGGLTGHTNNDTWEINVGHEIHINESMHINNDLSVDGDFVVTGALRSHSPVKVYDGLTIMGNSAEIFTERAPLELAAGTITPQITLEADGTLTANTADYEDLVTEDNDFPNRKFVMEQMSVALGTHIVEGPADTDIIAKDPGDPTKIITIAPFKLRTVTTTDGITFIKSIVSVPAGVEVINTIPAFTGGWLGVREATGTYEFFSKGKRDDFDLATECPIGRADRTATDISAIVSLPELGFGYAQDLYDLMAVTGLSKHISGGDLQAIAGGLTLKRLEGRWWRTFANRDENQRHKMTNDAHDPVTAYEIHSAYGDVEIPTEMEVGFIDDGAGGKTAIGADEWSYYLCYHWPRHTGVGFEGYQRSTKSFVSLHEARSLRGQGIPEMHPALDAAVLTHIIYIKGDATDLANSEQCSVEWVRKDNISSSGDPLVGGLQQSGVIDWDGAELMSINSSDNTLLDFVEFRVGKVDRTTGALKFIKTKSATIGLTVPNIANAPFSYVSYNIGTDIFEFSSSQVSRIDLGFKVPIGRAWHRNNINLDQAQSMQVVVETTHDFVGLIQPFGAFRQDGLVCTANGTNKKINLSTGALAVIGGTTVGSREGINTAQPGGGSPISFTPVIRKITSGKAQLEVVTSDIDFTVFDDGSGTLATISSDKYGIHYLGLFPFRDTTDIFLIRGNAEYSTLLRAEEALGNEIGTPSDFNGIFYLTAIIAKGNTTDLTMALQTNDASISKSDKFGTFFSGGVDQIINKTTGWLWGAQVSIKPADDTKILISPGAVQIVTGTDNPVAKIISWDTEIEYDPGLSSYTNWIGIRDDGSGGPLVVNQILFNSVERRYTALLGKVRDNAGTGPSITNIDDFERPAWGITTAFHDFVLAFGSFSITGNDITASATDPMRLNKSAGESFRYHTEDTIGRENHHLDAAQIPRMSYDYHIQGSSQLVNHTDITADLMDDGAGGTKAVSVNKFTRQEIRIWPVSGAFHMTYGQTEFGSLQAAIDAGIEPMADINTKMTNGAIHIASLVIQEGTTNILTSLGSGTQIIPLAGRGGGSGGGGISNIIEDLTPQAGGNFDFLDKTIFSSTGAVEVTDPSSHTYLKLNTTAADLVSNLEFFNNNVHKWSLSSKGAKDLPNDRLSIYNTDAVTEVMTLLQNGNVGMGAPNTKSALHIKGNAPGTIGTHPAGQLIIQNPGTSDNSNAVITGYASDAQGDPYQQLWYLGNSSSSNSDITLLNRLNSKLHLGTNALTRMTITDSGDVGIGTGVPDRMLHIKGSNANIHIERESADGATLFISNINGSDTTHWKIETLNNGGGAGSGIFVISDDGTDSGGVSTTRVIVDDNGHMSLGDTLPVTDAALDIKSTTAAFMPPRMTTTQRDALTASNGMMIYNTTTNQFEGYENSAWVDL